MALTPPSEISDEEIAVLFGGEHKGYETVELTVEQLQETGFFKAFAEVIEVTKTMFTEGEDTTAEE